MRLKRAHQVLAGILLSACSAGPGESDAPATAESAASVEEVEEVEVLTYRSCSDAPPGALAPLPRSVPADQDLPRAALEQLVAGVNDEERARGCSSFFSARTAGAVQDVRYSADGDTIRVDFRDFSEAIPEVAGSRSFLPPGIMAEITWTVFQQFPDIDGMELSFDGDQAAFWTWLGGEAAHPQVFTRTMWERI